MSRKVRMTVSTMSVKYSFIRNHTTFYIKFRFDLYIFSLINRTSEIKRMRTRSHKRFKILTRVLILSERDRFVF